MNRTTRNAKCFDELQEKIVDERLKFYREENAKFEATFSQCKLPFFLSDWPTEWNMKTEIDQLCTALDLFDVVDYDGAKLAMSFIDREYEKNNYKEKLMSDTNTFMAMTDEILKDTEFLSRELDEANKLLEQCVLSNEDSDQEEKKILAYRNDIAKFEKKHPWLKNPELDLSYIAKEGRILASMQEEKEALEKELEIYQGLKPDLQEASHQLSLVKKQYKELKDKFHQGV